MRGLCRHRSGRGFTLVELLVAIGLMAILAVLSWRGLETILQSRQQLVAESDQLRALTLTLSQLEEDLMHSVALRPLDLGEDEIRVEVTGDQGQQTLMLLREVNRLAMPTRMQRVFYEVRNGVLLRGFTAWKQATEDPMESAGVGTIIWQPILDNVVTIQFRGWVADLNRPSVSGGSAGDGTGIWLEVNQLAEQLAAIANARAQLRQQRWAARQAQKAEPPETGLAARRLIGLEFVVVRGDGQRFVRVYSVLQ